MAEPHDDLVRADEQTAYQAVRAVADRAVPVVGAGLAAGAGVASSALLGAALAGANSAELTPVFAALLAVAGPDALELVDQLAALS